MRYRCCDERRLEAVRQHAALNGIEYLEVLDRDAPVGSPRQRTLLVHCLKPIAAMTRDNVRIRGGERLRDVAVVWAARAPAAAFAAAAEQALLAALPDPTRVLVVRTDSTGDYTPYRLELRQSALNPEAPAGFDPQLAAIEFSFKVECDSEFDCKTTPVCPEPFRSGPEIDYLAKDYASFRRLLLDRITQLVPGWRERSVAGQGVALAEMLAYVGDHLSYEQDAVGTEAYLNTARRRTSLRRHALLVDYRVHEGSNARAWVHVKVNADGVPLKRGTVQFLTRVQGLPLRRLVPGSPEHDQALAAQGQTFELLLEDDLDTVTLFKDHNLLTFYTWGDRECCLPAGSTRATLQGHLPNLATGDVLVFEEVIGPATGSAGDADPGHRHPVRLTAVRHTVAGAPLTDPLNGQAITEIEWGSEDRLPFPLCISSVTDEEHGAVPLDDVSVARGNVVLVDHGRTFAGEKLGSVPPATLFLAKRDADPCTRDPRPPLPPRFRPRLPRPPLTHQGTVTKAVDQGGKRTVVRVRVDEAASAAEALKWRLADSLPAIDLTGELDGNFKAWAARRDLLNSSGTAREFVVEVEDDGAAILRFGDGRHGARPPSGTSFTATYRVGNGPAGNVGAEAIYHVVTLDARIDEVRNPMAAAGGAERETTEEVRRRAPQAFRTQERAVTPEDYAAVTERHASVQRAAATLRWTGSWHTVFVTVDRAGGERLDVPFEASLLRHVDRYRMAGHDLEFDDPRFVSLELAMRVCVAPEYFRDQVKKALLEVFSRRVLPDGRRGLFHPDNFSFGQTIYLSPFYAAARSVAGVQSVEITTFQRQGIASTQYLDAGRLSLGRLEIARLDNDPNFPERGVVRLVLGGGK